MRYIVYTLHVAAIDDSMKPHQLNNQLHRGLVVLYTYIVPAVGQIYVISRTCIFCAW